MARPLRIQYPGAWYHIMNRGRRREEIFLDKTDYLGFIDLLHETSEMFLGDDKFVNWVRETFFNKNFHKEVPQSKSLAPSVEEIRNVVCKFYDIDEKELFECRRGVANEPRKIAICLARRLRGDRLVEIAKAFNMGTYSSVSSVVNRISHELQTDSNLKKSYRKIYSSLTMRQAKT